MSERDFLMIMLGMNVALGVAILAVVAAIVYGFVRASIDERKHHE